MNHLLIENLFIKIMLYINFFKWERNKNKMSIIDYVLLEKEDPNEIKDVRVK